MEKLLSQKDILDVEDLETQTIDIPEWGGVVRLKTMTGSERDSYEASLFNGDGKKQKMDLRNVRAKLVGRVLIDDNGVRLFSDSQIAILGNKSAAALDKIFAVAQKMNGFSDKDIEDIAKNSETGQSDVSTSD